MVVDPGCMKCQDCISVCPEDALYFGFGKPALFAKARRKLKKVTAPQFSWREELALLAIFGFTLVVLVGLPQVRIGHEFYFMWAEKLYGQVPLLFGLGLSAITAFVVVFAWRVLRRPDADFLGLRMKAAAAPRAPASSSSRSPAAWTALPAHSAVVQ